MESQSVKQDLDKNHIKNMINTIAYCEDWLSVLLYMTEKCGRFCSIYPKEALRSIKIMRDKLDLELK